MGVARISPAPIVLESMGVYVTVPITERISVIVLIWPSVLVDGSEYQLFDGCDTGFQILELLDEDLRDDEEVFELGSTDLLVVCSVVATLKVMPPITTCVIPELVWRNAAVVSLPEPRISVDAAWIGSVEVRSQSGIPDIELCKLKVTALCVEVPLVPETLSDVRDVEPRREDAGVSGIIPSKMPESVSCSR